MSGRIDEAEEALSRARAQAFEKYDRYRKVLRDPERWLARLTYNVCMDLHRELKKARAREVLDSSQIENTAASPWVEPFESPERICLRNEMTSYLRLSIRDLPPRLRSVMELLLFEEQTYAEIAGHLAISQMALRKRVQKARSLIRRDLTKYFAGEVAPRLKGNKKADAKRPRSARTPGGDAWSSPEARSVWFLQVDLPSGLQKDVTLFLTHPPGRITARRLARLEKYVHRHPTGWKKRLEMARVLRQNRQLREAISHYRFVVERQPARLAGWLELAEVYDALEQPDDALEALSSALESAERGSSRAHLSGLIAAARRDWSKAEQALGEALALEPGNFSHRIALARVRLETGRAVSAAAVLERALELDPENSVLLTLSHDALLGADRRIEAHRRIKKAVESDGTNFLALGRLIDQRSGARLVCGEAGRKTRRLLDLLRRKSGMRAQTERSLALFRMALGQWNQAERGLADFAAIHPGNAEGWLYYAEILFRQGRHTQASAAIAKAHRLDPLSRRIRLWVFRSLTLGPPSSDRLRVVEQTLVQFPEDCELLRLAAICLMRESRPRQALEVVDNAIRFEPNLPAGHFCRGRILSSWGRTRPAIEAYQDGWALLPSKDGYLQSSQAAIDLGDCWRREGDHSAGRRWFQTAVYHADALSPSAPAEACLLRAKALDSLGERDFALDSYQSALKCWLWHPERAEATSARMHLLTRRRRS